MTTPTFDVNEGLDAELARLGVTGALWGGALGVTAPVRTEIGPWPEGMSNYGYISDDGITEGRDEDSEQFTPWQSTSPIRTEITRSVVTFAATLWESSAQTISLYYKTPVTDMVQTGVGDAAVVSFVERAKAKPDRRALGVDVVDDIYHRRMFAPNTEVTERGEIVYKSDTLIGYEVTITAYPGSDGISVLRIFREGWELPDPTP
jgi:hypothetical protein